MNTPRLPSLRPRLTMLDVRRNKAIATERIRGDTLQAIRRRHFQSHPLCKHCEQAGRTARATELDHIVPLWAGGRDDDSNRQGLCHECHAAKSKREASIRAASGTAIDCMEAERDAQREREADADVLAGRLSEPMTAGQMIERLRRA